MGAGSLLTMAGRLLPWRHRLYRLVRSAQWVALAIGIIAGVVTSNGSNSSLLAAATAGIYVLAATALPLRTLERRFVVESVALLGALLTMTSVTLTGASQSPYLLLSIIPSIQATILGGLRTGAATGLLSGSLLVAVTLAQDRGDLGATLGLAALYLVLVATVAQVERILTDISLRNEELEASTAAARRRLQDLESAHHLLTRLAGSVSEETSAATIGRTALEEIADRFPGSAGVAAVIGENGPVIVARHGTPQPDSRRHVIPLKVGARDVGFVMVSTANPLSEMEQAGLDTTLRPVALAFANVLLLQDITHTAIQEERNRVARELHDEIGPSLASLGLSLDMAMLEHPTEPGLVEHLQQLRTSVGSLVGEVRSTVSDLRTTRAGSLKSHLAMLEAALNGGPALQVSLDERRPPRPSIADQVVSIVTEAVRNAHRHSGGTTVRVRGWTDFDRGSIAIEDDGGGFAPDRVPDGHFGLIGMQERAAKVGVSLSISTGPDGTKITVAWGET